MNVKTIIFLSLFSGLFASCDQEIPEDGRSMTLDNELVRSIRDGADSSRVEDWKSEDIATVEYHFQGDDLEDRLYLGEEGEVLGIERLKRGKHYFTQTYYPNGQVKDIINYKAPGIQDGPAASYYPSGQLLAKGQWKDRKRTGHWVYFNEDGSVMREENYGEDGILREFSE